VAPGQITAGQAAHILGSIAPSGAVEAARCELAAEFTQDLRGIDAAIRGTRKKLTMAVRAAGTSLTGLFGAGPSSPPPSSATSAPCPASPAGTTLPPATAPHPFEVSPGGRKICRLSRRGNRRLNHAIHMAAVTQIRYRHSQGRACYDKKLAEGKTGKEALRCLKRQISDAIYACLQAGPRRAAAAPAVNEPGRATGERPCHRRGRLTPPAPALRESPSRAPHYPTIPAAAAEDPAPASLSRLAAIPRERAAGSRTGRSPAAQRRTASLTQPPASR